MEEQISEKYIEKNTEKIRNFSEWFLSGKQKIEKGVSVIVLLVEIILLINHSTETFSVILMQGLNLFFLFYFLIDFKNHYGLEFRLQNPEKIEQINHFNETSYNFIKLQNRANIAIKQFRHFRGFIVYTAILYSVLILFNLEKSIYLHVTHAERMVSFQNYIEYIFNLIIHFLSYLGVIHILICFYVMYFPSISYETETDDLKVIKLKNFALFVTFFIMFIEIILTCPVFGNYKIAIFYFEFICGLINAILMILFFARLESKLLGINPVIILVLYIYAIMQTALPFITNNILQLFYELPKNIENAKKIDLTFFNTLVLSLCLLGKIILYNIIIYLYQTKRIFYYFIVSKLNYDKEENYWKQFNDNSQLH